MRLIVFVLLLCVSWATFAQQQELQWQGKTLTAKLLQESDHNKERIFVLVHGTWAHYDMEIISTLQGLLSEAGHSSLAINLSLGVDKRKGFLSCDEPVRSRQSDAAAEIALWLAHLKQSWPEIILLGHSRGGLHVAMLNQQILDQAGVSYLVLLAPMVSSRETVAVSYEKRFGESLADAIDRAHQAGSGFLEVGMHHCEKVRATGESFLSYYGPDVALNSLSFVKDSRRPVLIAVGTEDNLMREYSRLRESVTGNKFIEEYSIDGADHFFRDLYADELIEKVLEWSE